MQPAPEPDFLANTLHIVFATDPVSVRTGLARLLALPPLARLNPEDRSMAELVLAEILNNVAEHAYGGRTGTVAVMLGSAPVGLEVRIVDHGAAMPGGQLPAGSLPGEPDMPLDDLPEGGFGWHLIRALTQNLQYIRADGRNQLDFTLPTGRGRH